MLEEPHRRMRRHGLVRPRRGKVIAGVCAGIARKLDTSPTLVRVAFAVSVILPGPQFLIYVALWALMPKDG